MEKRPSVLELSSFDVDLQKGEKKVLQKCMTGPQCDLLSEIDLRQKVCTCLV